MRKYYEEYLKLYQNDTQENIDRIHDEAIKEFNDTIDCIPLDRSILEQVTPKTITEAVKSLRKKASLLGHYKALADMLYNGHNPESDFIKIESIWVKDKKCTVCVDLLQFNGHSKNVTITYIDIEFMKQVLYILYLLYLDMKKDFRKNQCLRYIDKFKNEVQEHKENIIYKEREIKELEEKVKEEESK